MCVCVCVCVQLHCTCTLVVMVMWCWWQEPHRAQDWSELPVVRYMYINHTSVCCSKHVSKATKLQCLRWLNLQICCPAKHRQICCDEMLCTSNSTYLVLLQPHLSVLFKTCRKATKSQCLRWLTKKNMQICCPAKHRQICDEMLCTSISVHLNSAHLPLPFLFVMLTIQWPLNVDTFGTVLECPVYRGVLISGVCI